MKYETDSFVMWLNSGFQVMLAKCKKTGRFVKRSLAYVEFKLQDAIVQFGCGMALIACIASLPSALAYVGFESLQVSIWIWSAFMLLALLVLPLFIIQKDF